MWIKCDDFEFVAHLVNWVVINKAVLSWVSEIWLLPTILSTLIQHVYKHNLFSEITKLYHTELLLSIIKGDIKSIDMNNISFLFNCLFILKGKNMKKIVDY